jgi:uncharacterized RDD family membrane protein YckC
LNDYHRNASLLRRAAAIFYDSFLIVAIWMLSTTLLVALVADGSEVHGILFQLFLYLELFAFYYVFWRIKGQTLGMQVWKIKAVSADNTVMTRAQCLVRFLIATLTLAPLGFGYIWGIFRRDNLTLYDQLSNTKVIYVGSRPYPSEEIP